MSRSRLVDLFNHQARCAARMWIKRGKGQPGTDRPAPEATMRLRQRMRLPFGLRTIAVVSAKDWPSADQRSIADASDGRRMWGNAVDIEHRARPAEVTAAHG
jgi:hypothetical protein